MRKMLRVYALLFGGMAIIADQYTKQWAVENFSQLFTKEVTPFFNFVLVYNRGIAFGLFNSSPQIGQIAMIVVALLVCCILLFLMFKSHQPENVFAYGLIVGGALGNVVDRMVHGAVVDFLDFHLLDYHWPAFNLADSFIFVGVAALLVSNFRIKKA